MVRGWRYATCLNGHTVCLGNYYEYSQTSGGHDESINTKPEVYPLIPVRHGLNQSSSGFHHCRRRICLRIRRWTLWHRLECPEHDKNVLALRQSRGHQVHIALFIGQTSHRLRLRSFLVVEITHLAYPNDSAGTLFSFSLFKRERCTGGCADRAQLQWIV